jgi:hypothetical protein
LRKFSVIDNDGEKLFALNNKPYFLSAVLDQGYTPDGGLTFPSQKAMESDIALMKRCGFNSVRKHIKIEPLRWYAICDSQGLIVIQDFVNGGSRYSDFFIYIRPFLPFNISDTTHRYLGRALKESRDRFTLDLSSTVEKLYNVPSIAIWTIFNEGWGQFDTVSMTKRLRELDQTRLIDSASGWYDKKCGDIHSNHVYFFKPKLKNDHKRILALSECGGYSLGVNRHKFSKVDFGYKQFHSFDALNYQVEKLYRRQILRLVEKKGLSGVVFTQLTDVENETNGIVTYDRKVNKIDTGMLKRLNFFLYETFNKIHRDN